jgi:hypothetical protein
MRAQRAHQNNVELMSVFMPIFLIIGLFKPKETAMGGLVVLIFRIIGGIGYTFKMSIHFFFYRLTRLTPISSVFKNHDSFVFIQ